MNKKELKILEILDSMIRQEHAITILDWIVTRVEHKYEFKVVDNNAFVGHVMECYVRKAVSKAVSKAGTIAIHQCAAKLRFDSWCEAMGLDGEVINEKDGSNCNRTCEIIFKIKW